jgi:putative endonuclease
MFVYIIQSASSDKFYVGETIDLQKRLDEHNSGLYKGAHTSNYNDWVLMAALPCRDRSHARNVERHIKKMKSRKYIENLIKYSEMREKLIDRY